MARKSTTTAPRDNPAAEARRAAIQCVRALEDLHRAADEQASNEVPADYRRHVATLYKALRTAWQPINCSWPELAAIDAKLNVSEDVHDREPIPPVEAWITAKLAFWTAIADTLHNDSAILAWEQWRPEYEPDVHEDPLYPDGDVDVWRRIREFFAAYPFELWQNLTAAIEVSQPTAVASGAETPTRPAKPTVPAQPQPLPAERGLLERLLQRLDEFIDAYDADLQRQVAAIRLQLEAPGDIAASAAISVQPPSTGLAPPPVPEVGEYLDPVPHAARSIAAMNVGHDVQRLLSPIAVADAERERTAPRSAAATLLRHIRALQSLLDLYRDLRGRIVGCLGELENRAAAVTPGPIGPTAGSEGERRPRVAPDAADEADAQTKTEWYHEAGEEPPSEFEHGPLVGQKKDLTTACGAKDPRTFEGACRRGQFWARKRLDGTFEAWFKNDGRYQQARKRLDELQRPQQQ